jgi:hypothetical protein
MSRENNEPMQLSHLMTTSANAFNSRAAAMNVVLLVEVVAVVLMVVVDMEEWMMLVLVVKVVKVNVAVALAVLITAASPHIAPVMGTTSSASFICRSISLSSSPAITLVNVTSIGNPLRPGVDMPSSVSRCCMKPL